MKYINVEASALCDWVDASFDRNIEDKKALVKKRILCFRDRFVTIHSCKNPFATTAEPSYSKSAVICPIFKKGVREDVANYRPLLK